MSVINQMLKDLEQRQSGSEGAAVYVAPVRQQGWWMLALTLAIAATGAASRATAPELAPLGSGDAVTTSAAEEAGGVCSPLAGTSRVVN